MEKYRFSRKFVGCIADGLLYDCNRGLKVIVFIGVGETLESFRDHFSKVNILLRSVSAGMSSGLSDDKDTGNTHLSNWI